MSLDKKKIESMRLLCKQQSGIIHTKLNNLLSNKINWIDIEGIYIHFDSYHYLDGGLFYFFNRGVPVAEVSVTKLCCVLI